MKIKLNIMCFNILTKIKLKKKKQKLRKKCTNARNYPEESN